LRALHLDDEARRRLGGRAIVTRDGPRLFIYASSEEAVHEAERVVGEMLAEEDLSAEVSVTRYHPVEGAWKDASVPLPATDEELRAEYERKEEAALREASEQGEFPWEVEVDVGSLEEAIGLVERLRADGLPVHRRWHHVLVGVPTEERAAELSERLRSDLPEGAEVSILAHDVRYPVFTLLGSAG
jgi:hypothetical protein